MHVIHIFGASGSGTTTLANALSGRNGWFHMDTDDYFWAETEVPYTVKRPVEERLEMMRRDIAEHGDTVISGSLCGWGDPLMPLFTLAVRLDVPTEVRISRLRAREYAYFGDRILPGGDMEKVHRDFIEWTLGYDNGPVTSRSSAMHDLWQRKLTCPLLRLDGTQPVEALADAVKNALNGK